MSGVVTVIRETRLVPEFPLSRGELGELCAIIMDALELADHTFELKLVDDGEIARLNSVFMGCIGPTNVLSFPAGGVKSRKGIRIPLVLWRCLSMPCRVKLICTDKHQLDIWPGCWPMASCTWLAMTTVMKCTI